ncbi:MAG: trehalose-phosphatase [Chloroflexi bacterium]|nr:trehalose-phosphatase [Chloroflexota bacterium]
MQLAHRLGQAMARGQRVWLFLDYDGTLAEFAPTPDVVLPNPQVIDLLRSLARLAELRITILSGRRLAHIRQLVPVAGIALSGTYGIEMITREGQAVDLLDYDSQRPVLDRIRPQWAALIEGRQGFYLEDKGWTLAIHARRAEPHEGEHVLAEARKVIQRAAPPDTFRLEEGYRFIEIAPTLADKGQAIAMLLERYAWPGAKPVYIGDDDKDEPAFAMINRHGGVSILVSNEERPTQAGYRLPDPAQVHRWLRTVLESYRQAGSAAAG